MLRSVHVVLKTVYVKYRILERRVLSRRDKAIVMEGGKLFYHV